MGWKGKGRFCRIASRLKCNESGLVRVGGSNWEHCMLTFVFERAVGFTVRFCCNSRWFLVEMCVWVMYGMCRLGVGGEGWGWCGREQEREDLFDSN
jgi:hypothetical protein